MPFSPGRPAKPLPDIARGPPLRRGGRTAPLQPATAIAAAAPGRTAASNEPDPAYSDYAVISQSYAKTIGRLQTPHHGATAIAVARTAAFDDRLTKEFHQLREIGGAIHSPRVVPLYCSRPIAVPSPHDRSRTSRSAAYLMKWIQGFHSRTDRARFDNSLATLSAGKKATASGDLEALDRYLKTEKTIPDLQVMLEIASGRLYVLDPGERGLTPARSVTHPYVAKWRGLLSGELTPHRAAALDAQRAD